MSTLLYCFRQAFSNLRHNFLFSAASALTVAACVFLFSVFFSVVVNVQNLTLRTESLIGITVFFTEDASMEQKEALGDAILEHGGVKELSYQSAEEAWENFKDDYFGEHSEELAEAFAGDNPLAASDSYEIFMENIEDQEEMVDFIRGFDIAREVNYSHSVVSLLKSFNRAVYIISAVIIGLLFVISVFLISNTIGLAAELRRHENEIMRMIGATSGMIRAPFVIEGMLLGFIGAAVPVLAMFFIYRRAEEYFTAYIEAGSSLSVLRDIAVLVPFGTIYPAIIIAGLLLGVFMGTVVSFFTIRSHLRV